MGKLQPSVTPLPRIKDGQIHRMHMYTQTHVIQGLFSTDKMALEAKIKESLI